MQGYLFLMLDNRLEIRTKDFIESQDPGFTSNNRHWIKSYWYFDTENPELIVALLSSLSRVPGLKYEKVADMCKAIGLTPPKPRKINEGKIQYG